MKLYFGLTFDDSYHPAPSYTKGGVYYAGPKGLVQILEAHLGTPRINTNNDYIRIEQYRQALLAYLQTEATPFFDTSFEADQFATAAELLNRRDELLRSGWDFQLDPHGPERLRCLARIEAIAQKNGLAAGSADRLKRILSLIPQRSLPLQWIGLCEPMDLLPPAFQHLFKALADAGVAIESIPLEPISATGPDLRLFQQHLSGQSPSKGPTRLQGDGSLILLRGQRSTDLASFLAKTGQLNPAFQPLCLLPSKNRLLDNALVQEGLPSMGILTASLARPALQVLKLVTVFLWYPLDPFKVLEFLSLPIKPLDGELAHRLAIQIAQTPGVQSEAWYAALAAFFEEAEQRTNYDKSIQPQQIREQYRFWFERKRYDSKGKVPKEDVHAIFHYVKTWARQLYDEKGNNKQSLLILSEQAKRLTELVEALPETELSPLELERLVRTIYEPAPIQFKPAEQGHWPFVYHAGAIFGPVSQLLWWEFIQSEPAHFFSRWYQQERSFLAQQNIRLLEPADENALLIWHRKNPVLRVQDQLILCIPEKNNGVETHAHPLMGNLQASFDNLNDVTISVDEPDGLQKISPLLKTPSKVRIDVRQLGKPQAFVQIKQPEKLVLNEEETYSSLDRLFFYPYQWAFKYKLKLNKTSILSIVRENTLMGNLSHRLLEKLLRADPFDWSKEQVEAWVREEGRKLLSKEGAVLLLYGKEPVRVSFINKIQYAAWSLINLIKNNGWKVAGIESNVAGDFIGIPIKGRVDLTLERKHERAVIDLKWRGLNRRKLIIKNQEDLQLVLYSKMTEPHDHWAHTAYFIIEKGSMIARNNLAFKEINPIDEEIDHQEVHELIMKKMEATLQWRQEQLRQGQIEIRCQLTAEELEEVYSELLMDILEMKNKDAPFDDYRTLIDLVD
jgi:ATP-dependent helicase/nuclease subunit B